MTSYLYLFGLFFFFNDTATTEIYTLSLHDALPICPLLRRGTQRKARRALGKTHSELTRSEEHTSELQSPCNLVCRLLLEKKKKPLNKLGQARRSTNSLAPISHRPSTGTRPAL